MPESTRPYRLVVLVSGSGSNLQSLIDNVHLGDEPIEIVRVVSSSPTAVGLQRADRAGIPTAVVALRGGDRAERDARLVAAVEEASPDLIVLAGWMSILTGVFLDHFADRVINLHPSLLPSFPGLHAIEQALEWGVRLTGVTVHYAEEVVDAGPPILQRPVAVHSDDTVESLTARIREVEHQIVPDAVRLFASGRVRRDPHQRRRVQITAAEDREVQ